jgi:hypothetical protein
MSLNEEQRRTALEDEITEAVAQFVSRIATLTEDEYLQEGVMKMSVREVVWEMLDKFGDRYALADQLEVMAKAVREHQSED